MRGVRAGLAVGVAMVVGLAGAGTALACNEPKLKLLRSEAKAGDTVPFEISDIDEDAAWELTLNYRSVASGVDNDGRAGVRGQSFTMPALSGATRAVYVMLTVRHQDGGEFTAGDGNQPTAQPGSLRFLAEEPAPPPPPPANADPAPVPEPGSGPRQVEVPSETRPTGVGGSAPTGGTGGVSPGGPGGSGGGPIAPNSPAGPSGGLAGAGADAGAAIEEASTARSGPAPAPAARAALPDRATEGARRPALRAAPAPRVDSADGSGRLVLVLVALTAAGLVAALAVRWRRGGAGAVAESEPPLIPGDSAVEAELQEMIAEERAKLPRAPDERPPAEVAAARDDPG